MTDWRPSATRQILQQRAKLLADIRRFFDAREACEVDVPVLGERGVTDLHIDCVTANCNGSTYYLQSSPEYFMKRLLAAGSGDIYYLGKAFRDGEAGRRHNPEFTMLEWYRLGWDEHQLMGEVTELITGLTRRQVAVNRLCYRDIFQQCVDLDPHTAELSTLQKLAAKTANSDCFDEDRSTCLDLIFSVAVEPQLPAGLAFVYDYPVCQAALARITIDDSGQPVARRFEAFLDGIELANGYCELTAATDQRQRFEQEREKRREARRPDMQVDEKLLAALESGLPDCAGVALGVDRLLMILLDKHHIGEVNSFPFDRL